MRAKLHAKLMLNLTEEEMEVVEKENLLLEDFLEKEKKNKRIIEAYAQEVNEIFNST
jgi:arginine deiminase